MPLLPGKHVFHPYVLRLRQRQPVVARLTRALRGRQLGLVAGETILVASETIG